MSTRISVKPARMAVNSLRNDAIGCRTAVPSRRNAETSDVMPERISCAGVRQDAPKFWNKRIMRVIRGLSGAIAARAIVITGPMLLQDATNRATPAPARLNTLIMAVPAERSGAVSVAIAFCADCAPFWKLLNSFSVCPTFGPNAPNTPPRKPMPLFKVATCFPAPARNIWNVPNILTALPTAVRPTPRTMDDWTKPVIIFHCSGESSLSALASCFVIMDARSRIGARP